ncbi:Ubiquitin family protein [Euphorbia peplus]|nr:Ubiquitin family protein [Euphorbia peplus]
MQIFVKTLNGKTKIMDVEISDTIEKVKKKVEEMEKVAAKEQRLIYGGASLKDGCTLADCNIDNHSTLFLLLRLRSCKNSCPHSPNSNL